MRAPDIGLAGPGPVTIIDGGSYNLGTTTGGTPITRTITVSNTGTAALSLLTDPPTVTGAFSVTNFGATSVAVGGSTTFDVTCDATALGAPAAGTVSFNNNDPNENPFNFIVTCTVNPPPPFTVNSLADTDDGTCNVANCTLREAINAANSRVWPDTINFSVSGTITLSSLLPEITDPLSINGPGTNALVIDGDGIYRLISIYEANTQISDLTLRNGFAGGGAGAAIVPTGWVAHHHPCDGC